MGKAQSLKKYLIYLGENLTPWQSHQQSVCCEKVFNSYLFVLFVTLNNVWIWSVYLSRPTLHPSLPCTEAGEENTNGLNHGTPLPSSFWLEFNQREAVPGNPKATLQSTLNMYSIEFIILPDRGAWALTVSICPRKKPRHPLQILS